MDISKLKSSLIKKQQGVNKLKACDSKKSISVVKSKYDKYTSFANLENYQEILAAKQLSKRAKVDNPFFCTHDGVGSATTTIQNKKCINFSSYNYLNLNGDRRVSDAAKNAIDHFGTSVSASRIVSGEREPQRLLETALATLYNVDDALVFVSGHATNVTTIGYLFGENDLVLHDELIHNSVLEGIKLSGSKRIPFRHNDYNHLEKILEKHRCKYQRILIVIEGIYSMDGDFPNLPSFIEIKKKYSAFLMVDEAHSLGVLGQNGRGIAEHYDVCTSDVDIWMGTLSKTLSGCGGYIAGSNALVENLRYKAPGFLYSVGLSCPMAAASLAALELMIKEPERVSKLQKISKVFLKQAEELGMKTANSLGYGVIVILVGNSRKAVSLSNLLLEKNINVQPVIYPAVEPNMARLRFFMNCEHTIEQVNETLLTLHSLL